MRPWWSHKALIGLAYSLSAVLVSVQKLVWNGNSAGYTAYENYVIFKNSFPHLLAGTNIYGSFPAEQWDLFKYSPAFALFMAPFSGLPDYLGLPVWNLLNALLPLWAWRQIPLLSDRQKALGAWLLLPELVISLQNSQSNGMVLGLILFSWVSLEKQQAWQGAAAMAASALIKIFGVFAVIPGFLYPAVRRRFVIAGLVCGLAGLLIPLLVVSPAYLIQLYQWWLSLLRDDHAVSLGLSVQGWLQSWFGWSAPKSLVLSGGLLVLGFSVLWPVFFGRVQPSPRLHAARSWASLLIWVVIFNHKAESPTFVIALCGAIIWYFCGPRRPWETGLLALAILLASGSPTDLFPRYWREHWVQPYVLKAVPCIVIWILLSIQLLSGLFKPPQALTINKPFAETHD